MKFIEDGPFILGLLAVVAVGVFFVGYVTGEAAALRAHCPSTQQCFIDAIDGTGKVTRYGPVPCAEAGSVTRG
jgi:hypothetical protein